jgi:hypothetical protein
MPNDEIEILIEELKELHLQERRILASIEQAYRLSSTTTSTNLPSNSTPQTTTKQSNTASAFKKGDHIIIVNKVRLPNNRPVQTGDRTSVVTGQSRDRIDFVTTNGTVTWRAPKNIRLLKTG